MKKHLILFPLMAGFLLGGCEFEIFGVPISFMEKEEEKEEEKKQEGESQKQEQEGEGQQGEGEGEGEGGGEEEVVNPPVLLEEFGDYKLAKSLEEGKRYIFAAYKHDHDKVLYFNGDYHRDSKGFYPFYLGGSFYEDSTDGAAELEIHKINDTEFTIQVHSSHEEWDGKYIGVYSASSSYGNQVMSVAVLDDPYQETYVDPKTNKQTDKPSGIFKFHAQEGKLNIYAAAADYKYEGVDEEAVPKYLGTSGDYQSIDCKSYEVALDGVSYDLAHFYEHK